MKERKFRYKGIDVTIIEDPPQGIVYVGDRRFDLTYEQMGGLPMWTSEEAFFATPDVMELARHFVDYIYLFDSPGRIIVRGGHGHDPDHGDNHDHDEDKAPPTKKSRPRTRKGGK